MKPHYIAMAGLAGYLPNFCEVYESFESAVDSICEIHELGRVYRARLVKDSYVDLKLKKHGNEYAEITECNCDLACQHSDSELPSNCTLDFCFEHSIKPAIENFFYAFRLVLDAAIAFKTIESAIDRYSDIRNLSYLASKAANNHSKFNSFSWDNSPYDSELWTIVYTSNRDSDLLTQSNEQTIDSVMSKFDDSECISERHNSWLCGYIDGYSIKVYTDESKSQVTDAFNAWCILQRSLENYGSLNDELWSSLELESTLESIESIANRIDSDMTPPNGESASLIYCWLSDNGFDSELEPRDGFGAYPSEESVMLAMLCLGWFKELPDLSLAELESLASLPENKALSIAALNDMIESDLVWKAIDLHCEKVRVHAWQAARRFGFVWFASLSDSIRSNR